jgi:hypothetical protein
MVLVIMAPGWQTHAREHARSLAVDMAQEIANDARDNIVNDGLVDTNDLLDSVRQQGRRVYVGTDHWAALEYGSRAHVIRPRIKRALWWDELSHPISHANHPGNREYAFMRLALYRKRG